MIPVPELELQDADGGIYPLEFPGLSVMEVSGLGMPPIRHWTTRSPYQHGRTHWGYAIQPRVVNLMIASKGGCDQGRWDRRRANCDMLSPLPGALILRLTYPDGSTFELHDVWYVGGYELSSADQYRDGYQIGGIQLECQDPLWKWAYAPLDAGESHDAEGRTCVSDDTWTLANALVFPFVGPYLLGTTIGTNTLTCTNDGTWAIKPVLCVEGPIDDWIITNTTTGDLLMWDGYSIAAGEIVTIDVPAKTVTNAAGDSLIAYVRGNFGTFHLNPGANTIEVYASGGVVNLTTTISVCWFVEFIGL